jgi:uncharacterized protein YegP (UPF0339 family)
MTRSATLTEAASARGAARAARSASLDLAALEFVIFQDNGGAYRWRIVAGDGATLVQSGSFESFDRAERAAHRVRDGAASAGFARRGGEVRPVDLDARRDRSSDDDLDAERWLDEGGSFNSDAVTRWPAQR